METTTLSYLIPQLRRHLYDYTVPYSYSDDTLSGYLLDSIKALGNRWHNKYRVATVELVDNLIIRNDNSFMFEFSEPPVIQSQDERAVILQASIFIKGSTKWNESGSAVSWRDEEISYSNLESARQRSSTMQDDVAELNGLFPIKLAKAKYGRLYGWSHEWD